MGSVLRTRRGCGRPRRFRRQAAGTAPALLLAMLALVPLAVHAGEPAGASTTDDSRREAVRSIPLAKVDEGYRDAVRDVISDPSLFRRLPTNVVDCQPEVFSYFAENPEVLVGIWRHMGLSRVELSRTGANSFSIRDGAGTTGKLVIVEKTCDPGAQDRVVIYAEGSYEGKPFPKPITAKCVFLLRSGSMHETNDRQYVASRLDAFVKLDRASIEFLAKLVHPLVGKTADQNFADTLSFVSSFSYTAEMRPDRIAKLARGLEDVDQPRREELAKLAYMCAEAGQQWEVSRVQKTSADLPAK